MTGFGKPPPLSGLMNQSHSGNTQRLVTPMSQMNGKLAAIRPNRADDLPPELVELAPFEFVQWWMTRQDSEEALGIHGIPFLVR